MEKNFFKVHLAGKDYTISGTESEEYMNTLSQYVETKYDEIAHAGGGVNSFNTLVMTVINVADDYLQLKKSAPDVRGRISELEDSVVRLEKELSQAQATIKALKEKKDYDDNQIRF